MANDKSLQEIAIAHGVSEAAVTVALEALRAGHGRQAQFNHSELGGMGQWSSGGMLMIGDMFNDRLKGRVRALFDDLAALPHPGDEENEGRGFTAQPGRWPADLGVPSSTGSQNGMHYAIFPETRRLAIEREGKVTVHDTGDHRITGVGQQQSGSQTLRFSSQHGSFEAEDFRTLGSLPDAPQTQPQVAPQAAPLDSASQRSARSSASEPSSVSEDVLEKIEKLHALKEKGALSQAEYDEKKRDLLNRL